MGAADRPISSGSRYRAPGARGKSPAIAAGLDRSIRLFGLVKYEIAYLPDEPFASISIVSGMPCSIMNLISFAA
jgi:hypothetical protein